MICSIQELVPTGGTPHILPAVPGLPSNLQPLVPVLNSPQLDGELSLQEKNVAAYIGGCIVHEINNKVLKTCPIFVNETEHCVYSRNHDFWVAKNCPDFVACCGCSL